LGRASQKELGECLKPLGLWRRRAISLQRLGREMAARHGRFPKTRDEIEDLPNVGQYIANAVLLFCHNAPEPLLDLAREIWQTFDTIHICSFLLDRSFLMIILFW
jgi:A/G-specific adenine glycosylase